MLSRIVASYLALGTAVLGQRTSPGPYAIVGLGASQDGSVPMRRNINDLQAEAGPQWDLYVQALSAMKKVDTSDPLSYFQISAIHGEPVFEWNNTGRRNNDGFWGGYCPHGEAIFLPWHRPYVLLFEQVLVGHARRIAAGYLGSNRAEYTQAAESLRHPYWDWADLAELPPATVPRTLTINTARGRRTISNPLRGYTFPQEVVNGDFGAFSPDAGQGIVRCPAPNTFPDTANEQLQTSNLGELIYDAFIYSQSFDDFSSTSGNGVSIEQAHNLVHGIAACGQQFADPSFAAFDPLFMLHHANVDRLWALWQVAHPDKADLSRSYRGSERFSTPRGTIIRPSSPLSPFFGQRRRAITSNDVASISDFGYTYEGLDDPPMANNQKREAREPQPSSPYKPQTSGYYGRQTSAAHEPQTSAAYEPQTSAAYEPQTSAAYEPQTSAAHEPQTSAYKPRTSYSPKPSYAPQRTDEERRKRAVATIKKLYGSKQHNEKRTVYLAHFQYRAEDLDRPSVIKAYLCNNFAGYIAVMKEPSHGLVYATLPLNGAVDACRRAGVPDEEIKNGMSVRITTSKGKDIPLVKVTSMKMNFEDLEETPSSSAEEFPSIRNRHMNRGSLKQYEPHEHHHQDYHHQEHHHVQPPRPTQYSHEVHHSSSLSHHDERVRPGVYASKDHRQSAVDGHRVQAESDGHGPPKLTDVAGYGFQEQAESGGYGFEQHFDGKDYKPEHSAKHEYAAETKPAGQDYKQPKPAKHNYGKPVQHIHEEPAKHNHEQPAKHGYEEPSQHVHEKPYKGSYQQPGKEPSKTSYGKPAQHIHEEPAKHGYEQSAKHSYKEERPSGGY